MFKRKYSSISGDPFKLEDDLPPCPKITKHDKVPPVQKVTSANNLWADKLCTHLNTLKMESSQSIEMNPSKGQWVDSVDLEEHINVLECVAVLKALTKFKLFVQNKSVLSSTDNATTTSYINHQGNTKSLNRKLRNDNNHPLLVKPNWFAILKDLSQ